MVEYSSTEEALTAQVELKERIAKGDKGELISVQPSYMLTLIEEARKTVEPTLCVKI